MKPELTKCDYEPAHLIPLVQDTGVLFALDVQLPSVPMPEAKAKSAEVVAKVSQASCNTASLGLPPATSLLGADFIGLFSAESAKELRSTLLRLTSKPYNRPTSTVVVEDVSKLQTVQTFAEEKADPVPWWEDFYSSKQCKEYVEALNSGQYGPVASYVVATLAKTETLVLVSFYSVQHGDHRLEVAELEALERGKVTDFQELNVLTNLTEVWGRLLSCTSVEEVYEEATCILAEEFPSDRILFYKYDSNGDGEVVAEKLGLQGENGVTPKSFLGLRFPSTDVPEQAKALIQRVGVRHISNVRAAPVALVPPVIEKMPLDLTDAKLRQPSIMHVKFLRNMGVGASTTISICPGGTMHGMIACHSQEPRRLGPSAYFKFKLIASVVAQVLDTMCQKRKTAFLAEVESRLQQYSKAAKHEPEEFIQVLGAELCSILQASTLLVGLCRAGSSTANLSETDDANLSTKLDVHCPADKSISGGVAKRLVVRMLKELPDQPVLLIGSVKQSAPALWQYMLQLEEEGGMVAENMCGLAVIRSRTCFLVFGRETAERTIKWAGRAATQEKGQEAQWLGPRNSFEEFIRKTKHCGVPWSLDDRSIVEYFYSPVLVLLQMILDKKGEMAQKLLSTMSHELRTPFNGVLGTLSLVIRDNALAVHLQDMLQTAALSAECVLSILDDMLLLSRMKMDRMNLDLKSFQLDAILKHVEALFSATAKERGVEIHISKLDNSFPSWDDAVIGDGRRLFQVFGNLVANALKFGRGAGDDSIWIRAQTLETRDDVEKIFRASRFSGSHDTSVAFADALRQLRQQLRPNAEGKSVFLVASVEDNGVGISPENLHRLFQPFEQLEDGKCKKYQGTGLGLTICKSLCELMNGTIWCSVPKERSNHGASFDLVVELQRPCCKDVEGLKVNNLEDLFKTARSKIEFQDLESAALDDAADAYVDPLPATASETTVLIAEDNSISRLLLKSLIEQVSSKTQVLCARDGCEAVELFERHQSVIKYCLFDCHMPRMDGLTAAKKGE